MKTFFVFCLLLLFTTQFLFSQQKIIINKANSSTETYNFSEIDSLVIEKSSLIIPMIIEVQPILIKQGEIGEIKGKGFGDLRSSYVTVCDNICIINFWSDTLIKFIAPNEDKKCFVVISINDEVRSNSFEITIGKENKVPTKIITNLMGRIVDNNNIGIKDVIVTVQDTSTITDINGMFIFENINVPKDRCYIVCRAENFYDASKAQVPSDSGVTIINLIMFTKRPPIKFNSSTGGTVLLNNGSKIVFPPNCFELTNGSQFSGLVNISSMFVYPYDSLFNDIFPGDLMALRKDSTITYLFSYGVFPVDVKTEDGRTLEIKKDSRAEISFEAHKDVENNLDSIESWYYDYKRGMWIEDGIYIRNQNTFTAKASHFSYYNPDIPMRRIIKPATIYGKVVNCTNDNVPASGIKIFIGQSQVTTDNFGRFSITLPPNRTYDIRLDVKQKTNSKRVIVNEGDSVKINFSLTNPIISGKVIDCDKKPIARMIYAKWGADGFSSAYSYNGSFSFTVPDNIDIDLIAGNKNIKLGKLDTCEFKNLGFVDICDSTPPSKLIDLVKIPSGTFRMGSIYQNETPMHNVTLTKAFYMAKYELSQEIWTSIMGTNPSSNKGNNLPVENITFADAIIFCNLLSDYEGLKRCYKDSLGYYYLDTNANGYRLPTEAEWEYACRAGTITDFYTGVMVNSDCKLDNSLNLAGWYCGNSNNTTHQIASKVSNQFGLYDMHGNVSEFIWGEHIYDVKDKCDPLSTKISKAKNIIIRGGNYSNLYGLANNCRSASRSWLQSNNYKFPWCGLRLIRSF